MKVRVVLEIDTEPSEIEETDVAHVALQVRKMVESNSDWSAYEVEYQEID